jgi:hypothetical protein
MSMEVQVTYVLFNIFKILFSKQQLSTQISFCSIPWHVLLFMELDFTILGLRKVI